MRLSKVFGFKTPFDPDIADPAILETQRYGSEEFFRRKLHDVGHDLFHTCRIMVRLKGRQEQEGAKTGRSFLLQASSL